MNYRSPSILDRLLGGCLTLLAGAVALYVAVRLIESVWLVLVGVGVGVVTVVGLITALRWHRQRW